MEVSLPFPLKLLPSSPGMKRDNVRWTMRLSKWEGTPDSSPEYNKTEKENVKIGSQMKWLHRSKWIVILICNFGPGNWQVYHNILLKYWGATPEAWETFEKKSNGPQKLTVILAAGTKVPTIHWKREAQESSRAVEIVLKTFMLIWLENQCEHTRAKQQQEKGY